MFVVADRYGSSTMPSQSLSSPSHDGAVGDPASTLQIVPMPSVRHTFVPLRRHTPTPFVHAVPLSVNGPSTPPSQSSSSPLQVSTDGFTLRTQLSAPLTQCRVPGPQTPS